MNDAQLFGLLPFLVLTAAAVLLMLFIAWFRNHAITAAAAGVALLLSFVTLPLVQSKGPVAITSLLVMDGYAVFFIGLVLAAALSVVLLSYQYLERREGQKEEYYLLLSLATLGCAVIVASNHFASFFLGLEILSVSLYGLIAYPRRNRLCLEAGIKYLILASISDGFLLFGMALIYAKSGTMAFAGVARVVIEGSGPVLLCGTALLIAGVAFKLSLVPFHLWTPDVYEGAPAPVTALLATMSKGAVFALILRYFAGVEMNSAGPAAVFFTVVAVASMVAGNILALWQTNVKRILAYSSIAHMGYLLVAFVAGGAIGETAVGFYLVAYFVTTLGAFGVITVMSHGERDADSIEDYVGLAWQRPWLAGVFTAMLLSLAGIPLTAGFIGKFYLIAAGVGSALWLMVMILIFTSVMGLFYYLRVIVAMY
jgi:NADH-quinone oxidoreductase subunit N